MRENKKGPAAGKQTDPKQVKPHLHSKIAEIKSQESLLLFLFAEWRKDIMTDPMMDIIWEFMEFLKIAGYFIRRRN